MPDFAHWYLNSILTWNIRCIIMPVRIWGIWGSERLRKFPRWLVEPGVLSRFDPLHSVLAAPKRLPPYKSHCDPFLFFLFFNCQFFFLFLCNHLSTLQPTVRPVLSDRCTSTHFKSWVSQQRENSCLKITQQRKGEGGTGKSEGHCPWLLPRQPAVPCEPSDQLVTETLWPLLISSNLAPALAPGVCV